MPSKLEFAGALDSLTSVKPLRFGPNQESPPEPSEQKVNPFRLRNFERVKRSCQQSYHDDQPTSESSSSPEDTKCQGRRIKLTDQVEQKVEFCNP